MSVTADLFDLLLGSSLLILGLIQVFLPHAATRLRSRFGNIRRFDGADRIYSSRHGFVFVRLCGLAFIYLGTLILNL